MRAEDKIFKAFFDLKEAKLYYNQIKEHTTLSHSSLQNALRKLTENKTFHEEKTKANVFYTIKNKKLIALKFSELALNNYDNLHTNVKVPLNHFLKNIPENITTIILFGSTVRKQETKNSDIDLLIVSHKTVDLTTNKKEAEITSKYPLSLFYATPQQFKQNNDGVIVQAKKTGIPIYHEQYFYEVMLDAHRQDYFR